jgi:RNA-directed DNA polymerase
MCASDVTATLDQALAASGLDHIKVAAAAASKRQRIELRGRRSGQVAREQTHAARARCAVSSTDPGQDRALASDLEEPHSARQADLERQVGAFVEHYNHDRYHESIDNLTPADVYFGRSETIISERQSIKSDTIANRRLQHRLQAA